MHVLLSCPDGICNWDCLFVGVQIVADRDISWSYYDPTASVVRAEEHFLGPIATAIGESFAEHLALSKLEISSALRVGDLIKLTTHGVYKPLAVEQALRNGLSAHLPDLDMIYTAGSTGGHFVIVDGLGREETHLLL